VTVIPRGIALPAPSPIVWSVVARRGNIAAAVCNDQQIYVWALADGRVVRTIDLGSREFDMAAISNDGELILVADYAGGVTVWSCSNGGVAFEQRVRGYLTAAAFSRDGRWLAIAPGPEPLRIFDVASNRLLHELPGTPGGFTALTYSRDGALIGCADGQSVRIYDARTGTLVAENNDFVLSILAVDFTRDGKHIIAAGSDKVVAVMDSLTGKTLRRTKRLANPVFYLDVSPAGTELAAVTFKANNLQSPAPVTFWNVDSLQQEPAFASPNGVHFGLGGWTEDGHFLTVSVMPSALHLLRAR
jgi:WD40 repeat protein